LIPASDITRECLQPHLLKKNKLLISDQKSGCKSARNLLSSEFIVQSTYKANLLCLVGKLKIYQSHCFASTSPLPLDSLENLNQPRPSFSKFTSPPPLHSLEKPKPAKVHAFCKCFSNLQRLESLNMPKHILIASAFPGPTGIAS
jgi:hypothetical protein